MAGVRLFPMGLMPLVCFWQGHVFRQGGLQFCGPPTVWECHRCKRWVNR